MAVIFMDSFDHYGTDENNMTDGAYAQIDDILSTGFSLSTANPRTGSTALRRDISNAVNVTRRVLGGAKTVVGQAVAAYFSQLPTNDGYVIYDFRDASNDVQVSIVVNTTGVIEVFRGTRSGTSLGVSSTPAVVAEAYQHIETWATFDNVVGEVEVRVNGVTVVAVSGVDTVATTNIECSQVALLGGPNSGSLVHGVSTDFDDYFVMDDSGSYINDFVGDRRVLTQFMNADTAQADWSLSTGADGYALIDEANPNDDTDYISTGAPGSPGPISEFEFEDLPAGVSTISAIAIVHRSRKTDAGTANVQTSIVSGSSEASGADRPMTEAYTYYHDIIEADPDTAAPFTPSAVNSAKFKIERTA